MIGKLLALPVRILNVPLKVVDTLLDDDNGVSKPLEEIADTIEEEVDDE